MLLHKIASERGRVGATLCRAMAVENLDLLATVRAAGKLASEIAADVRTATNLRASMDERRRAAMEACERIERSNVLAKLELAQAWVAANAPHIQRAIKAAEFIQALRGR